MKRVLFVSNLFPRPDAPRCGVFNASLIHAMHARLSSDGGGVDVCVPVAEWRVYRWRHIRQWSLPAEQGKSLPVVQYVPCFYLPWLGRSLAWFFQARALKRVCSAVGVEAVIGSWLYPDAVTATKLASMANVPCWVRLHGSDRFHLDHPRRGPRCRKALESAAGIMVNAESMKRELVERGIAPERMVVIRNGVAPECFHENPAEREPGLIVWVGNLVPGKRPALALQAFASLLKDMHDHDGRPTPLYPVLTMIGEGPLRHKIERMARRLGMEARVRFTGSLPRDAVAAWMRQADILLLTSRSEGMPNVVLEALASGTFVVASPVGDVPLLVTPQKDGWLAQDASPIPLRDQFAKLLRKALSRDRHVERHTPPPAIGTWDDTAKALLHCIGPAKGGN